MIHFKFQAPALPGPVCPGGAGTGMYIAHSDAYDVMGTPGQDQTEGMSYGIHSAQACAAFDRLRQLLPARLSASAARLGHTTHAHWLRPYLCFTHKT